MRRWTDQQMAEAVSEGSCYADVSRALGFSSQSAGRRATKMAIRDLGLSIAHWDPNRVTGKGERKHSDEQIISAFDGAPTVDQAMDRLGIRRNGSSRQRILARAEALEVPITRGIPGRRRDFETYLVRNGPPISGSRLRKRLIEEGIKEERCEHCGITEWRDGPAPLELDHVDGDKFNNEIENLRVLCCNCHRQTPTHSRSTRNQGALV